MREREREWGGGGREYGGGGKEGIGKRKGWWVGERGRDSERQRGEGETVRDREERERQ